MPAEVLRLQKFAGCAIEKSLERPVGIFIANEKQITHKKNSMAGPLHWEVQRWDHSGKPLGLTPDRRRGHVVHEAVDGALGEEIPEGARILSVVDAFDAITHDRPYPVNL